jgi:hypothetical protein
MGERQPPVRNAKCPECGELFARSGLRSHRALRHGKSLEAQKAAPAEVIEPAAAAAAAGASGDAERREPRPGAGGGGPAADGRAGFWW